MAIDSTLWAADIPTGSYTIGDVIELKCIDGPANVRSGRGTAILKNIFVGTLGSNPYWRIHIKNSDWIDEVVNFTNPLNSGTVMDPDSGTNQDCHDCILAPNSSWQVFAECIHVNGATVDAANSIFALIDIDYPQVSAVQDPKLAQGTPVSINFDVQNVAANLIGSMESSVWTSYSVDYFKAGYRYVLDRVEGFAPNIIGFIAFSNAAGMGGLQRIVPFTHHIEGPRFPIRYSSALVKGPMDIKLKVFAASATNFNIKFTHDYVKRANA